MTRDALYQDMTKSYLTWIPKTRSKMNHLQYLFDEYFWPPELMRIVGTNSTIEKATLLTGRHPYTNPPLNYASLKNTLISDPCWNYFKQISNNSFSADWKTTDRPVCKPANENLLVLSRNTESLQLILFARIIEKTTLPTRRGTQYWPTPMYLWLGCFFRIRVEIISSKTVTPSSANRMPTAWPFICLQAEHTTENLFVLSLSQFKWYAF